MHIHILIWNYPVTCRLSADESLPDGLILSHTRPVARWLQNIGLDAISMQAPRMPKWDRMICTG